jgi:DNA-binding LytR/AlgR family response regulator
MPGCSGFEMLAKLTNIPIVIFCTAYDQYALEAFETNSIDYLVKPVKKQRIEKTVQKLKSFYKNKTSEEILSVLKQITSKKEVKKMTSITVKKDDKLIFIKLENVAFFEADNNYTSINSDLGRHLSTAAISLLEEKLPEHFMRVHRSIIINKNYVNNIQKYFNSRYIITLNNKKQTQITTGRTYNTIIKNWIDF